MGSIYHRDIEMKELQRWRSIENPTALAIVQQMYSLSKLPQVGTTATPYSMELRLQLEASDMAQRLADWPNNMPDISEAMPWPMSLIERLARPKNHKQLAAQLCCYLEWYLDPSQRRCTSRMGRKLVQIPLMCALMIGLFIYTARSGLTISFWQWLIVVPGIFAAILPIIALLQHGLHALGLDPNTALILYYYLRDAYTTVPDAAKTRPEAVGERHAAN